MRKLKLREATEIAQDHAASTIAKQQVIFAVSSMAQAAGLRSHVYSLLYLPACLTSHINVRTGIYDQVYLCSELSTAQFCFKETDGGLI